MTRAAVGLGSNLGDRRDHLRRGLEGLGELGEVVAVSSLYQTAPLGGVPQGAYLNAVAVLDTELDPVALLDGLHRLEELAGRVRRRRWGPRTLDLDLLLYGDRVVATGRLTVPHPRLTERRFALEPLLEAWPDARLPDGRPAAGCAAAVAGQDVEKVDGPGWAR